MTPEEIDTFRSWIYPFGFLSSLAFGLRFFIQWWASERAHTTVVPRLFWYLSGTGNLLLMVHSLFQLHFPLYLLQSQHIVLSWRNLNIMKKSPAPLRTVVVLLFLAGLLATGLYALQYFILPENSFAWIRSPGENDVPFWLHLFGCAGIAAFSLRFWLQWWESEHKGTSTLSPHFWWISLVGACISGTYFLLLSDWVNFIGPACSFIPYIRNLCLSSPSDRCDVVILAGEVSGDLIGASISKALFARFPSLRIHGIAGPAMRESGVSAWMKTEKFQVMGLLDVLKRSFFLLFALHSTVKMILRKNPWVVFTIDQPSFSSAVAKRLKKKGYNGSLVQVVAPSVWAYKPQRADHIASHYNHILPLFSFETSYFSKKLSTTWIGHPMLEAIEPYLSNSQPKTALAIFPGSRPGEVHQNLSLQLRAASLLLSQYPTLTPAIVISETLDDSMKKSISTSAQKILGSNVTLVDFEARYQLMQQTKAAITKSGTVTLELGLFSVPFVCCYNLPFLTRFWALHVLKVNLTYFSLPNILLQQPIFPECILPPVTPQLVASALSPFLACTKSLPGDLSQMLLQQIKSHNQLSDVVADIVSPLYLKNGVSHTSSRG